MARTSCAQRWWSLVDELFKWADGALETSVLAGKWKVADGVLDFVGLVKQGAPPPSRLLPAAGARPEGLQARNCVGV
jgi:hypothetical protein